jgi:hypothetical protein
MITEEAARVFLRWALIIGLLIIALIVSAFKD